MYYITRLIEYENKEDHFTASSYGLVDMSEIDEVLQEVNNFIKNMPKTSLKISLSKLLNRSAMIDYDGDDIEELAYGEVDEIEVEQVRYYELLDYKDNEVEVVLETWTPRYYSLLLRKDGDIIGELIPVGVWE